MTLPANLILEKNKPNAESAWVVLLDITLTNGTVLRYARADKDLVFGRPLYTNSNVIGHWKLNDNLPDTNIIDSSFGGNTATLIGGSNTETASITGRINRAIKINAASSSSSSVSSSHSSSSHSSSSHSSSSHSSSSSSVSSSHSSSSHSSSSHSSSSSSVSSSHSSSSQSSSHSSSSSSESSSHSSSSSSVSSSHSSSSHSSSSHSSSSHSSSSSSVSSSHSSSSHSSSSHSSSSSSVSSSHSSSSHSSSSSSDSPADAIDTGDPFQSVFRDSHSHSVWIKPDDGNPAANGVFYGCLHTPGTDDGFWMQVLTSGQIQWDFRSNDNAGNTARTNDAIFANGATDWTHLVFVIDSTIDGVGGKKIYVNGVEQTLDAVHDGSTSGVTMSEYTSALDMYIGAYHINGSIADAYSGGIDNAMLFDKVLTQEEIDCLYNAGAGTELVPTTYTAIAFGLDATRLNNTGEIPTLRLGIRDVGLVLRPSLRALNGGIGSNVRIVVANTSYLAEDLTELTLDFEVLSASSSANDVTFNLGAPQKLFQRFPMERDFALFCQFRFRKNNGDITPECGYTPKNLAGYTLPSGNPVNIEVTAHGFATNDSIKLNDVDDPTPSLDAIYTITKIDNDNFTLNGTDGDDFAGAFVSGGTAGYAICPRSLSDCRDRENEVRFGGAPGLQQGGLRLV